MKFLIENWYLIVIALASGTMLLLPNLQNMGGGLSPSLRSHPMQEVSDSLTMGTICGRLFPRAPRLLLRAYLFVNA